MEQFKACERDTKTKAYSREGLAARDDEKQDPRELEKEDKRLWINSCLERLTDINDTLDVDIEKLSSLSSKGGKGKQKEGMEKLESRLRKNKWHISKLEQVTKLLDNDALECSHVDSIREDLEYFIEVTILINSINMLLDAVIIDKPSSSVPPSSHRITSIITTPSSHVS